MTSIEWNSVGTRTFETGVDRGVLFVEGRPGVPWNGLISVTESPANGEATSYYIDGVRRLIYSSNDEYQASIEAFTYPEEFAECDGTKQVGNGLFITEQSKKSFGLVYRTKVGNDLESEDHGYKIHVVYNAFAVPDNKAYSTLQGQVSPSNFSWSIFTKPNRLAGFRPTSHFVIDSRKTPDFLLTTVESIFYGSANSEPRLPSVDELMFLFSGYDSMFIDAGLLYNVYFEFLDAGHISVTQTETIDAGDIGEGEIPPLLEDYSGSLTISGGGSVTLTGINADTDNPFTGLTLLTTGDGIPLTTQDDKYLTTGGGP